jgi:hypothetical protein
MKCSANIYFNRQCLIKVIPQYVKIKIPYTCYINRRAGQTQLQYYIKYTIGGGYMFRPLRGHLQVNR